MAAVTQARYRGDISLMPGMAETMPAAIVMATVAEPTLTRTRTATRKASSTRGRLIEETAEPIRSPRPEYCSTYRSTPPQAVTNMMRPVGSRDLVMMLSSCSMV